MAHNANFSACRICDQQMFNAVFFFLKPKRQSLLHLANFVSGASTSCSHPNARWWSEFCVRPQVGLLWYQAGLLLLAQHWFEGRVTGLANTARLLHLLSVFNWKALTELSAPLSQSPSWSASSPASNIAVCSCCNFGLVPTHLLYV